MIPYHYHPTPLQKKAATFDTLVTTFTLQGTNISPKNGVLKMIFLFPRWDMLIPWKVPPREVGSWPTGKIPNGSQELDQARPAEEIWLDALITVLEEARGACSAGSGLEGGQGCYRDFFKKTQEMR